MTLGPLQGSATIGQALDVSAPVVFDNVDDACLNADVLYGDTRLSASQVHIALVDSGGGNGRARITSATPVDEPVVMIVLKAGCAQQSLRRYLVLADAPGTAGQDQANPAPVTVAAGTRQAADSSVVERTAVTARPVATAEPASVRRNVAVGKLSHSARAVAPAPVFIAGTTPELARPRLQLAVADAGALPALRPSVEMLSLPSTDPAGRAAAAALWRALNDQPQMLQDTAERVKLLESELAQLRALNAVTPAPGRPAGSSWIQGTGWAALVAALALLTGAALFLYRRRVANARSAPHWLESENYSELPRDSRFESRALRSAAASSVFSPDVDEELPLPPLQPPGTRPYEPLFSSRPAPLTKFAHSQPAALTPSADSTPQAAVPALEVPAPERRPTGHEEVQALQAAQHQAGFFAYMEQYDEAVTLLLAYIDSRDFAPPLAFLDLLNLYRLLDRREDYELWCDTLFCTFACDAPRMEELDTADDAGGSADAALERHPAAMAVVVAAWATPDALTVIEELLLGSPDGIELLSAPAYRELLWLHAIAAELCGVTADEPPTQGMRGAELHHAGLDFNLDADLSARETGPFGSGERLALAPLAD